MGTPMAPMTKARANLGAAIMDGRIYALGGCNYALTWFSNRVEVFDLSTGVWTDLPPMISARSALCAIAFAGELYALGGTGFEGVLRTTEVFNIIAKSWEMFYSLTSPRTAFAAGVIRERIYVAGGIFDTRVAHPTKSVTPSAETV